MSEIKRGNPKVNKINIDWNYNDSIVIPYWNKSKLRGCFTSRKTKWTLLSTTRWRIRPVTMPEFFRSAPSGALRIDQLRRFPCCSEICHKCSDNRRALCRRLSHSFLTRPVNVSATKVNGVRSVCGDGSRDVRAARPVGCGFGASASATTTGAGSAGVCAAGSGAAAATGRRGGKAVTFAVRNEQFKSLGQPRGSCAGAAFATAVATFSGAKPAAALSKPEV